MSINQIGGKYFSAIAASSNPIDNARAFIGGSIKDIEVGSVPLN